MREWNPERRSKSGSSPQQIDSGVEGTLHSLNAGFSEGNVARVLIVSKVQGILEVASQLVDTDGQRGFLWLSAGKHQGNARLIVETIPDPMFSILASTSYSS